MRVIALGMIAVLCAPVASAASVGEDRPATATLVATIPLDRATAPKPDAVDPLAIYSNVTTFVGSGYSNGGTADQTSNLITRLVADDTTVTTLPGVGAVTGFRFSVANLNAAAVSARPRVRFYRADGASLGAGLPNGPGTLISGISFAAISFTASSVSVYTYNPGTAIMTVTAGGTETIWCGITFDNNTGATGATLAQMDLLGQGIYNPVDLGSSMDVAFQTTAAGSFFASNPAGAGINFSGSPVANFGWELLVTTLPVELQSFDVN